MDFKKIKTETTAVTRQKDQFYEGTGNIYETVAILAKRANQISVDLKEELNNKLLSFRLHQITWKKCLRTANKLKLLSSTNVCLKQPLSQCMSF